MEAPNERVKVPSDDTQDQAEEEVESAEPETEQINSGETIATNCDKPTDECQKDTSEDSSVSSPQVTSPHDACYHIKWILWKNKKTPIITQNENGPCPLIAISNVLILKSQISLPSMMEMITAAQLMEYVGDCILENVPKNISESAQLNYEQNMQDAISILPKLQTGLDVNVRFTGVQDFEYTPECVVFDLLHIPLYHGWLVDPQTPEVQAAVSTFSYNQLVEKIINNKVSTRVELVTDALLAENFLQKTASQLTYHGLAELIANLKDDELGVLFRNNHFITLLKYKNELFQLVTDQGFLTEANVVWETLNNIEGDGEFVDHLFKNIPPKSPNTDILEEQRQIDHDYLMALSLQEDQKQQTEWEEYKQKQGIPTRTLDDETIPRAPLPPQGGRPTTRGSHHPSTSSESVGSNHSKNSDCVIL